MKECVERWLDEQFCGDRGAVESVYAEYRATLARLLGDLAAARASGRTEAVRRALHSIRGSAAMVGDTGVSELAASARGASDAAAVEAVEVALRKAVAEL